MSIIAKLKLEASVNSTSLADTIEVDVDLASSVMEEPFPPGDSHDIELFAGPADGIEFIFVKLEEQKQTGPTMVNKCAPTVGCTKYVKVGFANDTADPPKLLELTKSVLLQGKAAKDLLPAKIERVVVTNEFSVPVKLSILVARKKVCKPKKVLMRDGD